MFSIYSASFLYCDFNFESIKSKMRFSENGRLLLLFIDQIYVIIICRHFLLLLTFPTSITQDLPSQKPATFVS